VYNVKVNDVDELHQHIQTVWDELDQQIIDKAIKQWRTQRKLLWNTAYILPSNANYIHI